MIARFTLQAGNAWPSASPANTTPPRFPLPTAVWFGWVEAPDFRVGSAKQPSFFFCQLRRPLRGGGSTPRRAANGRHEVVKPGVTWVDSTVAVRCGSGESHAGAAPSFRGLLRGPGGPSSSSSRLAMSTATPRRAIGRPAPVPRARARPRSGHVGRDRLCSPIPRT